EPAAVAPPRVRFYLASRGNYFMAELAGMFAEGFDRLGARASLEFDAVPPREPTGDELSIVVAPHEFFPLFLVPRLGKEWPAAAAACWCLATEQPGSRCFEAGFRFAARCRGVFDINGLGVREFRRRGVPAEYVPLGYAPSAEAQETGDGRRDIDVLFLGHHSAKRARFFAQHAPRLAAWNCHLVLNDVQEPRLAGTPGFVSGQARSQLLRRARILLNLHSAKRHYFEWQRALYAMANGCLLVSETSQGAEPLVDGQHLVFADEEQLMDRCEEYLRDEPKRRALADRAYRFLLAEEP
ncbi:MAG: glycosyltransferase, partial [Thermoguttaceae bacterium]|nr:glycosyltransferase [Thermoguttaceae bacterium]